MKRYHIGFLSGDRTSGYSRQLTLGMQNAIVEQGHVFVKVSEQVPFHIRGNRFDYFKVAFEIAQRMDLDAYVIPVSMVNQMLEYNDEKKSEEALWELIKCLDASKVIIMECPYEGYRAILKDNRPAMRECLCHLIEEHGYKRIGYIGGQKGIRDADEREAVYFEEMEAHGLEVPQGLFVRGSFSGRCEAEINSVLDHEPEAIICACDAIAVTAYKVAHERGLMVGRDIAITGFDDIIEASLQDPPLSTVHMTGYDMGYIAGHEAIRVAQGLPQEVTTQTGYFINRGSCGEKTMSLYDTLFDMLTCNPVDVDGIVGKMLEASFSKADSRLSDQFVMRMKAFIEYALNAYKRHKDDPQKRIYMFNDRTVNTLISDKKIAEYFNLPGFQNAVSIFFEALRDALPDWDTAWLLDQEAHLHLRISRLLQEWNKEKLSKYTEMETHALQIMDDALAAGDDLYKAYEYMLEQMSGSGLKFGRICLFNNPVIYTGVDTLSIGDKLLIKGSLTGNEMKVDVNPKNSVRMDRFFEYLEEEGDFPQNITVSALIANNEVMGISILDGESIDFDQQMAILLVLSFAVKHLQMIGYQHEMVRLLNENNIMLTHQSQQDELTGLFNRRGFLLTTEIMIKNSPGKWAAVFYLDLDGLKVINDTFGHDIGDDAIKNTAEILTKCFRASDLIGRQGGDEFVAFSLLADESDIGHITERVEEELVRFNEEHDLVYKLSISIGYKVFEIDENTIFEFDHLMGEADEMLYEIKRKKKGSRRHAEGVVSGEKTNRKV